MATMNRQGSALRRRRPNGPERDGGFGAPRRLRPHRPRRICLVAAWGALAAPLGSSLLAAPQSNGAGADLADASGEAIYMNSCANCHGPDGTGLDRSLVAFEEELPDFTDCDFAAREPDGDWIAVAHEGGPVRGFSRMMPAFGGALSEEQLARVMQHIRTLCTDPSWPRGELNLPRALLAEKAYPEDEWVVEAGVDLEGPGGAQGAYVYEHRFGPRSQLELVLPYGWSRASDHPAEAAADEAGSWRHGPGDVALGVKHAFHHSLESGRIVSLGGEVILATGDEAAGLGAPGHAVEGWVAFGQILPGDAFLQGQAGMEAPLYTAANEGFGRLVLGASFAEGTWGRTWSPMVELQAKRDLETGAETRIDLVPQIQVALNARQHVLANFGVLLPVGALSRDHPREEDRSVRFLAYVLLDWFDGGFFEGW